MTDFDLFPGLMWTLTTAILSVTLVAAAIPLAAALTPTRPTDDAEEN